MEILFFLGISYLVFGRAMAHAVAGDRYSNSGLYQMLPISNRRKMIWRDIFCWPSTYFSRYFEMGFFAKTIKCFVFLGIVVCGGYFMTVQICKQLDFSLLVAVGISAVCFWFLAFPLYACLGCPNYKYLAIPVLYINPWD